MKVAYLVNQYPRVSHTFIRREIRALERQGVEILRYSVRPCRERLVDPADAEELTRTRIILQAGIGSLLLALLRTACLSPLSCGRALSVCWQLSRRSGGGFLRHLAYLTEAAWLRGQLGRERVDHLHAHFGTNSAAVALLTRLLGGPPYSFTVHGPEEFDHPQELSLQRKIRSARFVVAISDYGRSQLFRWCSYAEWPKVQVVRCSVDRRFVGSSPPPVPANCRLVCVGRLCEQKGQALLIQAVGELLADGIDVELVLVGDGELRGVLESLIRDRGLGAHVRITGWQSAEQVRQHIASSRAFVLPSFAEGLPVAIMEAFALARPVVSTYVAGIPELVRPGQSGWLVPAGAVAPLKEALREVLAADPQRLTEMGRHGAEQVARWHDDQTEAARLRQLFEQSRASGTG